jgi:hypothetical protein
MCLAITHPAERPDCTNLGISHRTTDFNVNAKKPDEGGFILGGWVSCASCLCGFGVAQDRSCVRNFKIGLSCSGRSAGVICWGAHLRKHYCDIHKCAAGKDNPCCTQCGGDK